MFVSTHKIRWLFLAKTIIVPPTLFSLLLWAVLKVPMSSALLSQKSTLSSGEQFWAWLGALNSALGFFSTTGVNMPNFSVRVRLTISYLCGERDSRDTRRTKECTRISPFPRTIRGVLTCTQSIRAANCDSRCVHFGQFCWDCSDKCRDDSLRPNSLGPTQARRSMGQPRLCILRGSRVRPVHLEHEYLSQLAECWE